MIISNIKLHDELRMAFALQDRANFDAACRGAHDVGSTFKHMIITCDAGCLNSEFDCELVLVSPPEVALLVPPPSSLMTVVVWP